MRLFLLICVLVVTAGCATDVVVSSGTVAETKKQESEQAAAVYGRILTEVGESAILVPRTGRPR